jgi:proteasome lid subunit RPN8/RPN11
MNEISNELIDKIKAHGEETYNEECCGAIFGNSNENAKTILDLLKFKNEKEVNRQNRFLITPDQYRSAENAAKAKNYELLGFYHSHPDHPAIPSQFDTDHALPWFIYIIVSVNKRRAGDLTAWILKDDRSGFDEQKIKVQVHV